MLFFINFFFFLVHKKDSIFIFFLILEFQKSRLHGVEVEYDKFGVDEGEEAMGVGLGVSVWHRRGRGYGQGEARRR